MRFEPPDVQVHFFRQPESGAANLDEIARRDERFQMAFERRAFFARNLEQLPELTCSCGMVHPIAQLREANSQYLEGDLANYRASQDVAVR